MAHSLSHPSSASIDWKKATSPEQLGTQNQSRKGIALEFISSDSFTVAGQETIVFGNNTIRLNL